MRYFNTTGPVNPKDHYYIPHRLDENELMQLIEQKKYFVLHAPRQSGKTTAIRIFVDQLNATGAYKAFYINVEAAQVARQNVTEGLRTILSRFEAGVTYYFGEADPAYVYLGHIVNNPPVSGNALYNFLQFWSKNSERPIIIFIDEIDSLVGDTLIAVLRQLRDGFAIRPDSFPQSICLVGVRDVRDYRIWSESEQNMVLGGSAFNIKAKSLVLKNFSLEQVRNLYHQHTQETGQQFTDEAINYAYYLTHGQPWLVNALAYQACFEDVVDRSKPITKEVIECAKEALILQRDTHIDQLEHKLEEPRVYKIIDAIISGTGQEAVFPSDDLQYVRDLGLVSQKGIAIANPIYQEIIPRALTYTKQEGIIQQPLWYQNVDGSLNTHKLLEAFTQFYRENSEIWLERFAYKEAGPHLLFMAFLQRVINGGGRIHREYALGRKRVDILVEFNKQRIVIELKVKRGLKTLEEGLEQTVEYMDINNATEGHLVIFDPAENKSWDEKIFTKTEAIDRDIITVWGL